MATRVRSKAEDVYEADFYVWTEEQAALLRGRWFEALDLANLIEEVEGLDDARKSAVLSSARVVIEHLLKLQHSPSQEPRRGWSESIIEHRTRLELELTPRLRQILEEELPRVYALTRRTTERKLYGEEAAADALPADCPYTLDQVTWRLVAVTASAGVAGRTGTHRRHRRRGPTAP